jgi:MerR family transcriptional regulator, light-induced transcriptional regulator
MRKTTLHSTKAAFRLTGVSPDIMRAWERRYHLVRPERDRNGHRRYSDSDIDKLRLLRKLVDRGHAIGRLSPLTTDELRMLLRDGATVRPDEIAASLMRRLFEAIAAYRPTLCDDILGLAMTGLSPRDAVELVIAPALNKAGTLWRSDKVSIAQEHLLTASVERLVVTMLHTFGKAAHGPTIVFTTLSGERHTLGALMAAMIAASRGIHAVYLGPELPPAEAAQAAKSCKADAIALSVVMDDGSVETHLCELSRRLGPAVEIWLGGSAASRLDDSHLPLNSIRFDAVDGYIDRIDELRASVS